MAAEVCCSLDVKVWPYKRANKRKNMIFSLLNGKVKNSTAPADGAAWDTGT